MIDLNLVQLVIFDIRDDGECVDHPPKYFAVDDADYIKLKQGLESIKDAKTDVGIKKMGTVRTSIPENNENNFKRKKYPICFTKDECDIISRCIDVALDESAVDVERVMSIISKISYRHPDILVPDLAAEKERIRISRGEYGIT